MSERVRSPSPRWRRGGQRVRLNERGIALVIAVFVLTVIGALVVALFFAGVQEYRMSDATRRMHRRIVAAETEVSVVLRQWPDTARSLQLYPRDSLVLSSEATVLRRLSPDLYFLTVAENALGMLIFLAAPCGTTTVDGVEMTPSNCNSDSVLQKLAKPKPIASRPLEYSF